MSRTEGRPVPPVEMILAPAAYLYGAVMKARNFAFEKGWKKIVDPDIPVLSIGNLTAGGTGKTPVTAMLTEGLCAKGRSVGIVSRGYGGQEKGPIRVPAHASAETARRFGDEPTWLAARFPDVPVFIGADRVGAVRALRREAPVDLVIADDAFQHRRLGRRFDIVILDALEPEWHYRPLPLGRMREDFASLRRADAVFITKTNLAKRGRVESLKGRIHEALRIFSVEPLVVELTSSLKGFMSLESQSVLQVGVRDLQGQRVVLVSGIGRPESFERLMNEEAKVSIAEHLVFADHHSYSESDFARMNERARTAAAQAIVVTEKDAVKMTGWKPEIPCWVTKLEAHGLMEGVYEALDRRLF